MSWSFFSVIVVFELFAASACGICNGQMCLCLFCNFVTCVMVFIMIKKNEGGVRWDIKVGISVMAHQGRFKPWNEHNVCYCAS